MDEIICDQMRISLQISLNPRKWVGCEKSKTFLFKAEKEEAKYCSLLSFGLVMCNSESDKVVKRRTVYGELGGKGQAQGDGSSTRT